MNPFHQEFADNYESGAYESIKLADGSYCCKCGPTGRMINYTSGPGCMVCFHKRCGQCPSGGTGGRRLPDGIFPGGSYTHGGGTYPGGMGPGGTGRGSLPQGLSASGRVQPFFAGPFGQHGRGGGPGFGGRLGGERGAYDPTGFESDTNNART